MQLTDGAGEFALVCTKDEEWLFYGQAEKDGGTHVYKMPVKGGIGTKVADREILSGPLLTLDGRHLAFPVVGKKGSAEAIVLDAETDRKREK